MNETALFNFNEILNRCQKRNTQIHNFLPTRNDEVTVIVFTDGTQATVNDGTLARIHDQLPRKYFAKKLQSQLQTA